MKRPSGAGRRHGLPQRGQAMVEFLIIFPTLLLLVLGAFQFALVYQAKLTLNYATFMAARQGALKNASVNVMRDALASGMTPLFNTGTGVTDLMKARIIAEVEAFWGVGTTAYLQTTQLQILNPTPEAYNALKTDSESGTEIPNDNLMYRDSTPKGGAAPKGMSVQDANLLTISVTYCTRLIVPIVNRVIYSLYFGITGTDVLASEYYADASTVSTVGKQCADPNDQIQGLATMVSSYVPGGLSFLNSVPKIPTTIPGINWNIGGYRIPIMSTATVRMQSPITQSP